jgi:hypothetical protein
MADPAKQEEVGTRACVPTGKCTAEYSYDLVSAWISHARTYIVDARCGMMSKDSKGVLLKEASLCLDLLAKAFRDSKGKFENETFIITEEN